MVQDVTDKQSKTARLPDAVRSELFGDTVFDAYRSIAQRHGAENLRVGKLAGLVLQMLGGAFAPEQLPEETVKLLEIDSSVAKNICLDIFNEVLVKYQEELDWIDFQGVVTGLGGEVEMKAEPQHDGPTDFLQSYIASLHGTQDKHAAQRLHSIFSSILEKRATPEAAIERMQRPLKLNGLELSESDATGLVNAFVNAAKGKGYIREPKPEPEPKEEALAPESQPKKKQENVQLAERPVRVVSKGAPRKRKPASKPAKPQVDAFNDEDAKEIEKHKQEKKHAIELPPIRSIEDVVKQVCEHEHFAFENPVLTDRCAKIVEARVRDVRTPSDTRRKLETGVDQGGLGVTGRKLSEMTEHLEKTVQAYHKHAAGKVEGDKRVHKEKKATARKNKEARARKEEQILSKRYAAMTGHAPTTSVAPVGPKHSRTSAAIAGHIETQQREGKIDVDKVRTAIKNAKEQPKPIPPKRPPVQPKMADVVSSKRLAGPTEELSRLNLIDFRRLSKDPVQATTKIKDKIDLLENRGYEMKVEGIKAWRESPLNRMYMKLAETAVLSGIPLAQALEQARSAGEQTLTDEELKAVMDLNAALRF